MAEAQGPVKIPISLDTQDAQRTLDVLKSGFNATAGNFKGAMKAVFDGITRDFRVETEQAMQNVLSAYGQRMMKSTGLAGVNDRALAMGNATNQAAGELGMAANRMSESQIQQYIRSQAKWGPGGTEDLAGQRRVRQIGGEMLLSDSGAVGNAAGSAALVAALGALTNLLGGIFDKVTGGMLGSIAGGR